MTYLTSFGASVTGPGHLADKLPNQDAWSHNRFVGGTVIVVADGLGSKEFSDVGSKAACLAVPEAIRIWSRQPSTPIEVLIGLIHLIWRARIGDLDPKSATTTCLFAFMKEDGSGLIGQLGDGLILSQKDGTISVLSERDEGDFANQTLALGATKKISAWNTSELVPGDRSIILCTDGIADDLLPEKYSEFTTWLGDEFLPLDATRRWKHLAHELRHWPTPHHTDDKTLAYLGRKK